MADLNTIKIASNIAVAIITNGGSTSQNYTVLSETAGNCIAYGLLRFVISVGPGSRIILPPSLLGIQLT